MAEIHVQAKKQHSSPTWIWILVALAIVAAIVYFMTRNNKTNENQPVNKNTTSYIQATASAARTGLPAWAAAA